MFWGFLAGGGIEQNGPFIGASSHIPQVCFGGSLVCPPLVAYNEETPATLLCWFAGVLRLSRCITACEHLPQCTLPLIVRSIVACVCVSLDGNGLPEVAHKHLSFPPPFSPLFRKRENAAFERVGVPAPAPARGAGSARVGGTLV